MNLIKISLTVATIAISSLAVRAQQQYKLAVLSEYMGDEQKEGTVGGYKIQKTIELSKQESKGLLKELKKKGNLEKAIKRCKIMPTYAILLNDKPYATIDVKTCPKIMYYKKNDNVEFQDLKVDNNVLKTIESLLK